MRIPPNNQWKQANSSDLFGSVYATKNIDFDQEGYARLSSRMVSVMSEDTDAQFNLPISIGRTDEDDFNIVTEDEPFAGTISPISISVTEESASNNPATTEDSDGLWFHNLWVVTEDNDVHYKAANGDWTDTNLTLTTSVSHAMEVFKNRNSLCIANGNVVKQYTESGGSFTNTTDLTIPSDYEVIGLAYANNRMGVITKLASGITGQNQDAFFFVWSGATTSAEGGYPIGSDMAAGIFPYMGSWVVVSRAGQLLYFNGGGFTVLTSKTSSGVTSPTA
jgi:hypothetical protein